MTSGGMRRGDQPEMSMYTLVLCSAIAIRSMCQGQPKCAATTVRSGCAAATGSRRSGCA